MTEPGLRSVVQMTIVHQFIDMNRVVNISGIKKRLIPLLVILLGAIQASAQSVNSDIFFYKGDWVIPGKTSFCRAIITIMQDSLGYKGAIYWTYISCDSSRENQVLLMKGKEGKTAIEFITGTYDPALRYFRFKGNQTYDPAGIITPDIYEMVLSADKKVIYGRSGNGGVSSGILFGLQISQGEGIGEIARLHLKM